MPAGTTAGSHAAVASGSNVGTVTGDTATAPFTVTTPTIVLSPTQGPVGTSVTVTGSGFSVSTTIGSITIAGGTIATQTCTSQTTSTTGAFTCSFTVPADTAVGHLVTVSGSNVGTVPADAATATFTVTTATLTLTPASGPVGTLVTLSGSGYAPSTVYTFCFQSTAVACASGATFTSSGTGAIPAGVTITVPASGNTYVDVSQGTAAANFIISATFTVTTPVLAITPSSGPVGTLVTLSLSSGALAPSTTYTYCAQTTATTCTSGSTFTSDATGAIPAGITLTISSAASNKVDLSSNTFYISATFTVTTPTLTLTPNSGPVGTLVTLSGSGYAASTVYTFCFQSTAVACASGATFTSTAAGAIPTGGSAPTITVPATGHNYVDVSQGTAAANFIISAPFTSVAHVVQSKALCSGAIGTNCAVALTSAVTSSDELVVVVSTNINSATCVTVSTFSDSLGSTFASTSTTGDKTSLPTRSCSSVSVYYATLASSGTDTITVHLSAAPTAGTVVAYEVSGVAASPTTSVNSCISGGCASPMALGSNFAYTTNAFLLVSGAAYQTTASAIAAPTTPAGFVAGYGPASPEYVGSDIPAATSSGTMSMTLSASSNTWAEVAVQFAPDASPSLLVSCTPELFGVGSGAQCTATITGFSSPIIGEVVSWSQTAGAGSLSFSSSECALTSAGTCTVMVKGTTPGSATVAATYGGDTENSPSSGAVGLTVTGGTGSQGVTLQPILLLGFFFSFFSFNEFPNHSRDKRESP